MHLKSYPPQLRPYVFHGVDLTYYAGDRGGVGECPFCYGDHFFVWRDRHGFVCKQCAASGNIYTFMNLLYEQSQQHWKESSYELPKAVQAVLNAKQLTLDDLLNWGACPSHIDFTLLFPQYNETGALSNLLRVDRIEGKFRPLGTPGCKMHPFRRPGLGANSGHTIYHIPEGLWDTITYDKYALANEVPVGVYGVFGSGSFNAAWFKTYFAGAKEILLLFDNDYKRRRQGRVSQPAKDGIDRIYRYAQEHDRSLVVKYLQWGTKTYASPSLPDGYDITDLARSGGLHPQRISDMAKPARKKTSPATNAANKRSQNGKAAPVPTKIIKPIPCHSFKALCREYEKRIHFGQQLRDTLAVMLAAVVSTPLDGDQLWFRIIGPPGSGKTTLAEAISAARQYVYPLSLQTGFHSGYIDPKDQEKDNSLLNQMNGKTCVIKDADTLLKSSGLDRILAEMRDFYDGVSRATYRNTVSHHYENLRLTFLLCGTDALRSLNRTDVGERFLDCEVYGESDGVAYVDRAMDNTFALLEGSINRKLDEDAALASQEDRTYLKAVTAGFINHLREHMGKRQPPSRTEKTSRAIKSMAQLIALIRARTRQDKETQEYAKARAEVPTRLTAQLSKLAFSLALVLETASIDEECLRITRKVAYDTIDSVELDIVRLIHNNQEHGVTCRHLSAELGLSERAILNRLNSLKYFRVVRRGSRSNNSNQRGRDVHVWRLSEFVTEVYAGALDPARESSNGHAGNGRPKPAAKRPTPRRSRARR